MTLINLGTNQRAGKLGLGCPSQLLKLKGPRPVRGKLGTIIPYDQPIFSLSKKRGALFAILELHLVVEENLRTMIAGFFCVKRLGS